MSLTRHQYIKTNVNPDVHHSVVIDLTPPGEGLLHVDIAERLMRDNNLFVSDYIDWAMTNACYGNMNGSNMRVPIGWRSPWIIEEELNQFMQDKLREKALYRFP